MLPEKWYGNSIWLPSYGRLLVTFSLSIEGCLTLKPRWGWSPANIRIKFTCPETRGIVLPDVENRTIVSSLFWTQYRNVTDGRSDRQTSRRNRSDYYSALHCEQCGRAVKIIADWSTRRGYPEYMYLKCGKTVWWLRLRLGPHQESVQRSFRTPSWWGGGCPLPKNPTSALGHSGLDTDAVPLSS